MGTAIQSIGKSEVLPDRFVMPTPTDPACLPLYLAVNTILKPHPDIPTPRVLPAALVEMARATLDELEPMMAPAPEATVTLWLWPIADGVEFTPAEDEFFRRARALHLVAVDVPHVAWTLEAQKAGLLAWRRLPSVSAVIDLVLPPVRPLLNRVRALRVIAGAR